MSKKFSGDTRSYLGKQHFFESSKYLQVRQFTVYVRPYVTNLSNYFSNLTLFQKANFSNKTLIIFISHTGIRLFHFNITFVFIHHHHHHHQTCLQTTSFFYREHEFNLKNSTNVKTNKVETSSISPMEIG